MAPKFILTQTMVFICAYMASRQYYFLLTALIFQCVWAVWFSLGYTPIDAHRAIYTRISALVWSGIFAVVESLIALRDNDIIESVFYYALMALIIIFTMTAVIAMSCHASCLGSQHWSTNVIELCALVWTAAHDIRGDLVKSGIPLCVAAAFIRLADGKNWLELVFWSSFLLAEMFIVDNITFYCTIASLIFCAHFILYGIRRGLFLLLSPFVFLYIFIKYAKSRISTPLSHKDALNKVLVDIFDKLKYKQLV